MASAFKRERRPPIWEVSSNASKKRKECLYEDRIPLPSGALIHPLALSDRLPAVKSAVCEAHTSKTTALRAAVIPLPKGEFGKTPALRFPIAVWCP